MTEFLIRTIDNEFYYDSAGAVTVEWENETNNKFSDTQGFMRKAQVGNTRLVGKVTLKVTQDDYYDILLPMLTYPDAVVCVFDRNMPGRKVSSGTFVYETCKILQVFADDEYQIEIALTEVIY